MGTYTINYDGIEITASSPADAAALVRELKSGKSSQNGQLLPAEGKSQGSSSRTQQVIMIGSDDDLDPISPENTRMALEFLKAIRDGAAIGGIQAAVLVKVLGVSAPKAIGSKSATINKLIKRIGLGVEKVYTNPKTASGRIWRPGRKMNYAIDLIEQRLANH
jgi:hypothetical protein